MASNEEILKVVNEIKVGVDTLLNKGKASLDALFGGTYQPPPAKIPNGPDDPPGVYQTGIVTVLAYFNIPKVGGRWYAYWRADNKTVVAEIQPYTVSELANADKCGKPLPEGAYSYGRVIDLDPSWVLERLVRNPLAPVPEGCKLADDGVNLIPV